MLDLLFGGTVFLTVFQKHVDLESRSNKQGFDETHIDVEAINSVPDQTHVDLEVMIKVLTKSLLLSKQQARF